MTVPNLLTSLRILMAITAACLFAGTEATAVAALLCIAASMLDWLDGWYARRFGQTTDLGAHLDPAADKILAGVIYVALAARFRWPWFSYLVGVMAVREAAVTLYRLVRRRRTGHLMPASRLGKAKTLVQCVVGDVLLFWTFVRPGTTPFFTREVFALMLLTTVLTVDSGLRYLLPRCPDGKKRSVTERIAQAVFGVRARES
ncbi:MAG: CDP-alcohol phosphatidyltransferase family protein [Candidatus Krumholzibacteriota bacterium]|nr:CDP-alcohol phosphatidyltransferase family protein [Candidatus Krumholzibacteriota bacterium]